MAVRVQGPSYRGAIMQSTSNKQLGFWIGENLDQSLVLLLHNRGKKPVYNVSIKWEIEPKRRVEEADTAKFWRTSVFLGKDVETLPLGSRADFLRINNGRTRFGGIVSYYRDGIVSKIYQRLQCRLTPPDFESASGQTLQESEAA